MVILGRFCVISILYNLFSCAFCYKPVILMHGVVTGAASMEEIADRIQEVHAGTVIYNIDRFGGWSSLETMWRQVLEIGKNIQNISCNHPDGVHLLGYSQGGLIARVILQTFPNHTIHNFISLSSPQAGQYGAGFLHLLFPGLVKETAYELFYSVVGQHTSVGNYWNDPVHQALYYKYSVFLPYVNNIIKSKRSDDFKQGIVKLKQMILIGGPDDQVITPWQSSQFGYYDLNQTVVELKSSSIYTEDLIGLQSLDKAGRLKLVTVPGINHFMWHKNKDIVDKYILPYLD